MLGRSNRKQKQGVLHSTGATAKRRGWNDALFYELQLNGPAPDRVSLRLKDPYTPYDDEAISLIELYEKEHQHLAGASQHQDGFLTPWRNLSSTHLVYQRFHSFAWLTGLAAQGERGKVVAAALVDGWVNLYGRYDPEHWQPILVYQRLLQFARHGAWLLEGQGALRRSRILTSIARQTRHLSKAISKISEPVERLFSAISLVLMGLGLPHHSQCEEQGATLLRRELRLQLRADGGHISRNPSTQLRLAEIMQTVLTAYHQVKMEAPSYLVHAINRVTDMVEFFRCGDGRLATFNEGGEDDPKVIASVLAFEVSGRSRIDFASQSGYQKLTGARTVLYADIGATQNFDKANLGNIRKSEPSGSVFSLQVSSGRQRIITNCGSARNLACPSKNLSWGEYREWQEALSSEEAHSTLCIDAEKGPTQDSVPYSASVGQVFHNLEEDRQGQLLEMERTLLHDGIGFTHRRRLFMAVDGDDIRGEDILLPPMGEKVPKYLLRFHLYPGIKASLSRDGESVILVTPLKEGWQFITSDCNVDLRPSIYVGKSGMLEKTEQIVVEPRRKNSSIKSIKWTLRK